MVVSPATNDARELKNNHERNQFVINRGTAFTKCILRCVTCNGRTWKREKGACSMNLEPREDGTNSKGWSWFSSTHAPEKNDAKREEEVAHPKSEGLSTTKERCPSDLGLIYHISTPCYTDLELVPRLILLVTECLRS